MKKFKFLTLLIIYFIIQTVGFAQQGDTSWMRRARYGVFVHYQYRILLGYSIARKPSFPDPSQMNAAQWNEFVDEFDVNGFAEQMASGKAGWVIFCIDDHVFAWACSPNKTFDKYTGYGSGDKCSKRDLIMDLAKALEARGIKLICYYAGLNGYMKEPKASAGLGDSAYRGDWNEKIPPPAESRERRLAVLKEYADRYRDKVAGWWFDGMELNTFQEAPYDWKKISEIVHSANPKSVIAFSNNPHVFGSISTGVDDYTGGDSWTKQDLSRLTPALHPAQNGILWHGKIYCGNIYHGLGDLNQFSDKELVDWIKICNNQGGVCTLDWPFDPNTGLMKSFALKQLIFIANAVK